MLNRNLPSEWYLNQFSMDDEWKYGVDPEMIERVESVISTEAIEVIFEELLKNGCPADRQKLGNLLRHWAKTELSEQRGENHAERQKRTRNTARLLAKNMASLKHCLDAASADVAYHASRHIQHQLRVHFTGHLFDTLRQTLEDLLPAVQALSKEKLPRGPRADPNIALSIETLFEIFEFVTGTRAGRTYDPIEGMEVSAFSLFVASAFHALRGNEAPATDWNVRVVLTERGERDAALRTHMHPTDND